VTATRTFAHGILDDPAGGADGHRDLELDLVERDVAVRALYRRSKRLRWNPSTDVPWEQAEAHAYPDDVRAAARAWWSSRAWGEYGAISESPALQLRFQHDGLDPDLSLYWTIRTEEEAKHAEASVRFADLMGGYLPELPGDAGFADNLFTVGGERVSGLSTRARALDADVPVEATLAGLVAVAEQLTYDVFVELVKVIRNPAAKQVFRLICRDEVRHCEFGWAYLGARLPAAGAATRRAARDVMATMVADVELGGYRVPWLAPEPDPAKVAAEQLVFDAGLGGSSAGWEWPIMVRSMARIRQRVAGLGIDLPTFRHPTLGPL
jgi:hypothetical protein